MYGVCTFCIMQAVALSEDAKTLPTARRLVNNMKLSGMVDVAEPEQFQTEFKEEVREKRKIEGEFEVRKTFAKT